MNHQENTLAPIVVFAYNRPRLFQDMLTSLSRNVLIEQSDVYIYVDGPKDFEDTPRVQAVLDIANSFVGSKSKKIIISGNHKGLAKSVTSGVTEVVEEYGRVIVLEDDLIVSRYFLSYMNEMLRLYEADQRIMQISGFGVYLPSLKSNIGEYHLCRRAQSWGWATWEDRWNTVDWHIAEIRELFGKKQERCKFEELGSDVLASLDEYRQGKRDVWLIAYIYAMYRNQQYCICPRRSLVKNNGFGPDASNCRNYNRYHVDYNDEILYPIRPSEIIYNKSVERIFLRYWTMRYRIYGKSMTIWLSLCDLFKSKVL